METLKQWAKALKRDVLALYLAAKDPRVPTLLKLAATLTAAYALSPIDLIPDFIPVLGYLDDVIIIPAAIAAIVHFIPTDVMEDLRKQSKEVLKKKPTSNTAAVIVVCIWVFCSALAGYYVYHHHGDKFLAAG